ncbi:MAG TPA: hypothetical protein VKU00_29935 [Chthonomonadaceae bacterium]|nr:hypothetical protein [Chthonomonadaceae bacterium]
MWKKLGILGACGSMLMLLYSCGGGGGGTYVTSNITRSNNGNFSTDAKTLAVRIANGPWLSAAKAAMFDTDLAHIRQQYSQVTNIHARGDYTLNDMVIAVDLKAPWRTNWEKGTLTTGDTSLDGILTTYGAASVKSFLSDNSSETFDVTFDTSLNTRALAAIFQAASKNIVYAEADGYIGDGDNITFEQDVNQKKYVFSHGWGDCSAGCIDRHYWTFTLTSDGSLALQESGTPLPPDGGKVAPAAERPTHADLLRKR